jgi:heat shock protein HtpX
MEGLMLPANGLYGHIRNNNIKSALLLIGFVILVGVLWMAGTLVWAVLADKFQGIIIRLETHRDPTQAELIAGTIDKWLHVSLTYAFVPMIAVAGWFAYAFAAHRSLIRRATGAVAISRQLDSRLYNLVENLTISVGLPVPRIEVIETTALNAYAAGLSPKDSTVAVTRGLLDTLSDEELEAVLAHEITHIRNRDVRLMVIATIFVGVLAYGSQMMRRQTSSGAIGRSVGGGDVILVAVAAAMASVAGLFGVLSHFALSRTREFLADAGAVELTKNPDALIGALERIRDNDQIEGLPKSMEAMMISSRLDGWFATHPSCEDRVSALRRFAGGRRTLPQQAAARANAPRLAVTGFGTAPGAPSAQAFGKRRPKASA